jgi:Uroporphyrinogen-III synthase HemD
VIRAADDLSHRLRFAIVFCCKAPAIATLRHCSHVTDGPADVTAGGLDEPTVVPRFMAALEAAGATPTRVPAYETRPGVSPDDISPEAALMRAGCVAAIVFTSTAEAQGLLVALGGADVLTSLVAEKGAPRRPAPAAAAAAGSACDQLVPCVTMAQPAPEFRQRSLVCLPTGG